MPQAGDFDYDTKGAGYAAIRRPDPRIAAAIHAHLGDARTVLNIGAGTGSYEPAGRHVVAIEPSAAMRAQRPPTAVPAIHGLAEALPLDDKSVDASMAVMTVHQWPDLAKGLSELRRVTRGPVLIVAGDGATLADFWLNAYAPELLAVERRRYPPVEAVAAALGARREILDIPIPIDCTDGFCEAFYARPERLLDQNVRRAQSSWSFLEPGIEARFAARLSADLANGAWDAKHGHWRTTPTFNGSLRLIVSHP